MNKKQRFVLGVSIIVILVGYLASTGVTSNQYQVGEALAAEESLSGKVILVNGSMVIGSDEWDPLNRTLTFQMTDGTANLDVIYRGEKPNIPDEYTDIQVIVTGRLNNGVFQAFKMLTKCPSKYEASTDLTIK